MLTFNKKNLSSLQRRSVRLFGGCLFLLVFLTVVGWTAMFPSLSGALHRVLTLTQVVPIVGMMAVVGRYVARETDEFIKNLVTQAVLWAAGCTLVAGIMLGSLSEFTPRLGHLFPMLSADVFCIVFIISLRTQLWRNA